MSKDDFYVGDGLKLSDEQRETVIAFGEMLSQVLGEDPEKVSRLLWLANKLGVPTESLFLMLSGATFAGYIYEPPETLDSSPLD